MLIKSILELINQAATVCGGLMVVIAISITAKSDPSSRNLKLGLILAVLGMLILLLSVGGTGK